MLCKNMQHMFGNLYLARTILLSIAAGSALTFLQHSTNNVNYAFFGNDAILRGLIMTLVMKNPTMEMMLFPIPVAIPAWVLGSIVLLIDFLTVNSAGYGGSAAAYYMLNYVK